MEFAIHRNELVRELQTVTGIVERRATLPILANLLVEADGGELALGASDLEVTIRGRARADVKRPGGITLPAARLHDIARSLPEAEVSFKVLDRNQVVISCGRTRFRISGQPREEFPEFPKVDVAAGIRLPARLLRRMIERVAFAISTEEPRYMLRGALLLLEKGRITLVATDGYRLAYIARAADVSPRGEPLRVIVPRKALLEVAKLAENREEEEDVLFGLAGNHLFFSVGEHLLTSTIPEGTFPRYEEVMPTSSRGTITVSTEELLDAVKRVALLAPERFGHPVRVELGPGKLELSSETEVGEAHEELPVDYAGEPIVRGFSPRYLTEFLTVVGSESVRLDLECVTAQERSRGVQPKDRPSQLQPEPAGEVDYRYIVMPRQA